MIFFFLPLAVGKSSDFSVVFYHVNVTATISTSHFQCVFSMVLAWLRTALIPCASGLIQVRALTEEEKSERVLVRELLRFECYIQVSSPLREDVKLFTSVF